jgi:hypothetical protein
VFEIVTVGLEHVEGLVLDLPAGAAAGGQFGDGVGRDREIRNEAVVVSALWPIIRSLRAHETHGGSGKIGASHPSLQSLGGRNPRIHSIVISVRFVGPGAERYTERAAEEGPSAIGHGLWPEFLARAALKISWVAPERIVT